MAVAAQSQVAVASFDFSGCGLSDGDHVSGWHIICHKYQVDTTNV